MTRNKIISSTINLDKYKKKCLSFKEIFLQYFKFLLFGIILTAIPIGCIYYLKYKNRINNLSIDKWQQIVSLLETNNNINIVIKFAKDNGSNIYGVLAVLKLVKYYVTSGQMEKAIKQLQLSLKQVEDKELESLLKLRLARIQLQQNQLNSALRTLKSINKNWRPIALDIIGNILFIQGNTKEAYNTWLNGLRYCNSPLLRDILRLKLHDSFSE